MISPGQSTHTSQSPSFAIVIPMLDEADTVMGLLAACRAAVCALGPYEIVVADDGSTDATPEYLRAFARANPDLTLRIVTHARPGGQSLAVHNAVRATEAPVVATLDGDGQNPPEELPNLLAPFLSDAAPAMLGLVAGQRTKRNDALSKRLASRAANWLRQVLLMDGTRDTGCGLKAFRRDAFLALPYFNHMHRFLPALFQRDGWTVLHVEVEHRPRVAGRSKYNNIGRAIVGASDLFGVAWLIRRRRSLPKEHTSLRVLGPEADQ